MFATDISIDHYLVSLVIAWALYRVGLVIYRLTLHPLANFPGPRLAAATSLYQIYYDIVKDGQMTVHAQELHKRYGPIVRTTPNEVHINEPNAYHEIYRMGTPFLKYHGFYQLFGLTNSVFGVIEPDLHKAKRSALNPSFSRRTILELEPLIQSKVEKLCTKLQTGYAKTGKPANMHNAYQALTIDTVTDFAFATSYDVLDNDSFRSRAMEAFDKQQEAFLVFKHFPILALLLTSLPYWLANWLMPDGAGFLEMQQDCEAQIKNLIANPDAKKGEHITIFNRLVEAYPNPDEALIQDLGKEGMTVVSAGTHTTRHALSIGTVYMLQTPGIEKRLLEELKTVIPERDGTAPYQVLEKLPYLSAFIKESLRLSYGVVGPLPRTVPAGGAVIAGQSFPGDAVVVMDNYSIHHNETIFPDSHTFNPDRWLLPNSKELDKYLVSFSSGTRQCLGTNLAMAELYIAFAKVVRRFKLELHEHEGTGIQIVEHWLPTIRGEKLRCTLRVREE